MPIVLLFSAIGRSHLGNPGLELSGTDLVVLLNILMHWWYPEQKPFPRPTTIARRMGTNVRTVQRSIQQLVELGLIERVKATSKGTVLDPSALVEKLNELAEEDRDYQIRLQKQQTA